MSWRGALLFCLGCSFDPAGLEGRPAPCLDGYVEVDDRCYTPDANAQDAGAPDADELPDVRVSDVPDRVDARDTEPMIVVDAFTPDVVVPPDASDECFCGMSGLMGCDPCADGEHRSCRGGEVVTGSSCVDDNVVATCNGDEEVFGECEAGCGESNGWGCNFRPSFITVADRSPSVLQGNELRIDTRRGEVSLDGSSVPALVSSVDDSVLLRVSAIDVDMVVVEGPGGVAIRASDTIRIRAGVDVGARGGEPGPGGFAMGTPTDTPCGAAAEGEGEGGGGPAGVVTTLGIGGGGGGFGTDGADGGNGGRGCPGFGQGGDDHDVGFIGGSAGGGSETSAGGGGGGALYLSARVAIFVDGVVEASGGGGGGGVDGSGAGGGSGGLIYFEAPIFATMGVELRANGGGGGGGARDDIGEDGEDGRAAETQAQGGAGESLGGAGSGPTGEASRGRGSFSRMGGGGGGGAGWIIIRTGDGEPVPGVLASPAMGSRSAEWQELP